MKREVLPWFSAAAVPQRAFPSCLTRFQCYPHLIVIENAIFADGSIVCLLMRSFKVSRDRQESDALALSLQAAIDSPLASNEKAAHVSKSELRGAEYRCEVDTELECYLSESACMAGYVVPSSAFVILLQHSANPSTTSITTALAS